jgi:PIN domain nuclease of toxin-antitoxin system
MASLIYADTHVVAWLYAGRADLIPPRARALLEDNSMLVSPMVALELEYLFETGRTAEPARRVLHTLGREIGLQVCDLPFPDVVEVAARQSWTRDPFDRIIVAQAALRRAPLVTRDAAIRAHYTRALWERGGG